MDKHGISNWKRMRKGLPPVDDSGKPFHLHHVIQEEPGPIVEISQAVHQRFYPVLHGLKAQGECFRHNLHFAKGFRGYKMRYWRMRAEECHPLKAILQRVENTKEEDKLFIDKRLVACDADVRNIEAALGVHLPKSYQWFLKTFGAGGVNGVFVEGMGSPDHRYTVVEETLDFRKDHPPALPEWVFLEWFSDDWVCLLDASGCHETTEECPVIAYQIGEDRWEEGWETFVDYIEERFFGE